MKHLLNASSVWEAAVLVVSVGSTALLPLPACAQATFHINHDTSSFENIELTDGDVGVHVSYYHYRERPEHDDNNLSYQLVYQGEEHGFVETFAWAFAEFKLQDLDSDGMAEVIVRNFSGGAHCCTNTTIHRWDGNGFKDIETGHLDGAGAQLEDFNNDGYAEVVIPHQAFLYRFGSYAESFPPMTIFTYRDGELVDTTHQFPDQIREQAETIRSVFLRIRAEDGYISNSLLASYVAQQAVLNDNFLDAWQFMLNNHSSEDVWGLDIYEDGEKVGAYPDFPTALRMFLTETGYLDPDGQPRDRGET